MLECIVGPKLKAKQWAIGHKSYTIIRLYIVIVCFLYLTRQVSYLKNKFVFTMTAYTENKPGRHWDNCAPPYGTPNHGLDVMQAGFESGDCSDASCTEMHCL